MTINACDKIQQIVRFKSDMLDNRQVDESITNFFFFAYSQKIYEYPHFNTLIFFLIQCKY